MSSSITAKEVQVKSPLINKKVQVKIIRRKGSWLSEIHERHDGADLWSHARITFTGLPYDLHQRRYRDPLTKEERKWFESSESGFDVGTNGFSILRKDNYWTLFSVSIDRNGMELDLSDPADFLRYKFLLVQPQIAPSWADRFGSAEYKFAIVDGDEELNQRISQRDLKVKANRLFGKIESSSEKVRALLNLYNDLNGKHKIVEPETTHQFMIGQVDELMDTDLEGLLDIMENTKFEYMTLVYRAVEKGAVIKAGKGKYQINGELETFSFMELVDYLQDPENNLIYARIIALVEGNVELVTGEPDNKPNTTRGPKKDSKN